MERFCDGNREFLLVLPFTAASPKAVKVVVSPHDKRVLILLEDGRVRCVESKNMNFIISGRIVYSGARGPLAQDIAC